MEMSPSDHVGAIFLFAQSFEGITEFHQSLMADAQNSPPFCLLVANKIDLVDSRLVSKKEGKKLAESLQMPYLECSAKTGVGITEIVQNVADELVRRVESTRVDLPARKKSNVQLQSSPFRVAAGDTQAETPSNCSC
jgi:50S ribosomal subunit-associated GTPase HflX